MRGVITHFSNPYIRTAWNIVTYIVHKFRESTPYLPNTLDSCAYFCRALWRLRTTARQLSSDVDRTIPKYSEEDTMTRGIL